MHQDTIYIPREKNKKKSGELGSISNIYFGLDSDSDDEDDCWSCTCVSSFFKPHPQRKPLKQPEAYLTIPKIRQ